MIQAKQSHELKQIVNYLFNRDKKLAKYVSSGFEGVELPTNKNFICGFSLLVKTIISQQLSGKVAETIFFRFVKKLELKNNFQPSNLHAATNEMIRECGVSNSKASFILGLRDSLLNNDVYFENLNKLHDDELENELTKLKGVGIWTARILMISLYGRLDVFPDNDGTLIKAIQLMDYNTVNIKEISNNWKPYRSVAAKLVWDAFDSGTIK
jgi:DNA-3-methyladenine glycosylase II